MYKKHFFLQFHFVTILAQKIKLLWYVLQVDIEKKGLKDLIIRCS
jgi:hypothetical protein